MNNEKRNSLQAEPERREASDFARKASVGAVIYGSRAFRASTSVFNAFKLLKPTRVIRKATIRITLSCFLFLLLVRKAPLCL
ncbi:MAG: hypothetical protein J5925_04445, partial [Clostridia bacterium]|nr:hypothetical protein [Clostridia bacterium]